MKTKEEIEKLAKNYCEKLTGFDYKNVAFLAYYHGYITCQEQQSDALEFAKWIDEKYPLLHLANEKVRMTLYEIFKKEKI